MKNAAAISAQLVDMRNVGTHKVLRLTLHVPEEQALQAIAAFGWPTGVNPVAVAIAALDLSNVADTAPMSVARGAAATDSAADRALPSAPRLHKPVAPDKRLAQQAGIVCSDPTFHRYVEEKYRALGHTRAVITSADEAAAYVRTYCQVASRAEIKVGTPEGKKWEELHGDFLIWRDASELVTEDCQGERV
jgi:hypothetical protein